MSVTTTTAHRQGSWDRVNWIRICALVIGVTALLAPSSGVHAQHQPEFNEALSVAADYHRKLSILPGRYPDQPETSWYENRRLTVEALVSQHAIDIQPCFAMWWAHEYMGLKLTAISHELRDTYDEKASEADLLERLGLQMWMEAEDLLPLAGSACGVAPSRDGTRILIPSASE